jgi:hypothetical protein
VYYITNTQGAQEAIMDIIRRIEVRDWVCAIIGFVAGAWIF